MQAFADIRRDTYKRKAIIDKLYDKEIRVLGGSFTEDTYGYIKGWQTKTNAWYAVYYKAPGVMGTKGFWVKVYATAKGITRDLSKL